LVRRYKRFLADVRLDDGCTVTAHCANSGSMLGLDAPNVEVLLRHVPDPRRKLAHTLEMVRPPGQAWVGVDTMRPNRIVRWAIEAGLVPGLDAAGGVRSEVVHGRSRIDLQVGDTFVEIKNTMLGRDVAAPAAGHAGAPGPFAGAADVRARYPVAQGPGPHVATFPDAITARGTRHMDELAAIANAGGQAVVVFFVNRGDCDRFDVARDVDAVYAAALQRAVAAGVRVVPLGMAVSPHGWRVRGVLPVTA
jgi:sugar fermentation stimulation protein A